jgi:hypothetical protein
LTEGVIKVCRKRLEPIEGKWNHVTLCGDKTIKQIVLFQEEEYEIMAYCTLEATLRDIRDKAS